MSESSTPNRWIPFQCPACHGLFRLKKSQVGEIGRCPTCAAALQTSEASHADQVASVIEPQEVPELSLEKLAVAETLTAEEIEKQEEAMKNRKRIYAGSSVENSDWEDQVETGSVKAVSWKVVVSLILSALVIGALGIHFLNRVTPVAEGNTGSGADESKTQDLLDDIVEASRRTGKDDDDDGGALVKSVDEFKKFDLDAVEIAVKAFLNAETVEEMKKTVRHIDRVGSLMDKHYSKVEFESDGFESINKLEVSYQGEFLTTTVQKSDFLNAPVAVERISSEQGDIYKVDWESWVGYCDYTPEEMRSQKPSEPFLMRVLIEQGNYYNYGFSDDQKWRCFGIELNRSDYSFLGYVEKDSAIDQTFALMTKDGRKTACVIKVAYPENSRAKDQFEIIEFVSEGWIVKMEDLEKDE